MPDALPILGTTDAGLEIVPCALCGANETQPYCTKFGYPIVKCSRCGLVYCNPRLSSAETDKRYNPHYFHHEYLPSVMPPGGPGDGGFLDNRFKAALDLLANGRPPGKLIEIGTGAGFFLKAAVRAGFDAYGLDLSSEAAAYARTTLGVRVIETSAEEMPFEPAYFDAAAMFEVIEHLRDPLGVVRAARRALRPGGRLIVSTPNLAALSRRVLGDEWAVLSPAEHLYYFTEATLRGMLLKAGFRSVQFVRTYAPWLHHETMNARYTHAPDGWRARAYYRFVDSVACRGHLYRGVQRLGLADGLLAVADA
jgi:SAM-dependent methyltransferase